jgi:transposase
MILDLHRQGLSVSAIARQVGVDRKTVRNYLAKGLEPPTYKKRAPSPGVIYGLEPYLRERLAAYPTLTARRLFREIKERGYSGGYSVARDRVRDIRPARGAGYEVRFETPQGEQAQVDFARFEVEFLDEPGIKRIVWLFSMVLGYSRLIWARFVLHQDLQSVLCCHIAASHHPLRSHEDRGHRRGRRRPRRLQPRPCRPRPPLRLSAARLPALSGQDQGEGRAAF